MRPRLHQYVATLEAQKRLRVPAEKFHLPSWLMPQECPLTVRCRIGRHRQVCLFPVSKDFADPHKIDALVTDSLLDSSEESFELSDFLRYSAGFSELNVQYESGSNRFTLVLPKELFRLGVFPGDCKTLVILSIGDSLELWEAAQWNHFGAQFVQQLPSALSRIEEKLEDL